MKKKTKLWLFPTLTFVAFFLAAILLELLLSLERRQTWILLGGMWVLGLLAAIILFFLLRSRWKAALEAEAKGTAPAEKDPIDQLAVTAGTRLAGAGHAGAQGLRGLPVLLFVGPAASTKTTVVLQGGLEAELLAGEVHRGEAVVSTTPANLWYSHGNVLVEAGGGLLDDRVRWERLLRHIRPKRIAAALSRGRQAPRVAIVCVGCDELLKPGASEAVPALAKKLRARLAEAADLLGIRLPVYVLFTKADRLPYFEDYVRSFSREEAQQVFGATLPAADAHAGASYAERESGRIGGAFRALFRSLSVRRADVLSREADERVRAGAYEFPREFRKITDLATEFLVELCRPSQLGSSPFLRGFYFTGVRAIIVNDPAAGDAPAVQAPRSAAPMDATMVFDPRSLQGAQPQAARGASRKVPEWLFLKRVFRHVVLEDRAAMNVTASGARVNVMRRVALGAVAALFLFIALGFTVSYVNNHRVERQVIEAARATGELERGPDTLATEASLVRLDSLRSETVRLASLARDGHGWRFGWGLYQGDALFTRARRIYFDRFRALLWDTTRASMLADLRTLPDAPDQTSSPGTAYDALKAHLITTSHPQYSTSSFLSPVLLRHWLGGRDPGTQRLVLAQHQFDFFADELPRGNPYDTVPEMQTVDHARAFLRKAEDSDRFYQTMIADASAKAKPIRFNTMFEGSRATVINDLEIPGAFTKDGYAAVKATLDNTAQLLNREQWVMGEASTTTDVTALEKELRSRYAAEYQQYWRRYLAAGSVVRFSNPQDAATKLGQLSDPRSPLLQMIWLASQNTAVDTTSAIDSTFQPVHAFLSPALTDRYIGDANAEYMTGLAELRSKFDQAALAQGDARTGAMNEALGQGLNVKTAITKAAANFSTARPAIPIGDDLRRLLQQPVTYAEAVVRVAPTADVNSGGAAFCAPFATLDRKFPFSSSATTDATIDEVSTALQRGSGALWNNETAQNLLVRQGPTWRAKPGAQPEPSAQFVNFYNRATRVSEALYTESGDGPTIAFGLRPQFADGIDRIVVQIGSRRVEFTPSSPAEQVFVWNAQTQSARISARVNSVDVDLAEPPNGPWALFRIMQEAQWEPAGGQFYNLRWRLPGQQTTLTLVLRIPAGVPIFQKDYLRLNCTAQIAR